MEQIEIGGPAARRHGAQLRSFAKSRVGVNNQRAGEEDDAIDGFGISSRDALLPHIVSNQRGIALQRIAVTAAAGADMA